MFRLDPMQNTHVEHVTLLTVHVTTSSSIMSVGSLKTKSLHVKAGDDRLLRVGAAEKSQIVVLDRELSRSTRIGQVAVVDRTSLGNAFLIRTWVFESSVTDRSKK